MSSLSLGSKYVNAGSSSCVNAGSLSSVNAGVSLRSILIRVDKFIGIILSPSSNPVSTVGNIVLLLSTVKFGSGGGGGGGSNARDP